MQKVEQDHQKGTAVVSRGFRFNAKLSVRSGIRRAFSSSCVDFLERRLAELLVLGEQDALAPQLGVQEVQAHLAEVLVLGEEVVENA